MVAYTPRGNALVCPGCRQRVPLNTIWIYQTRFFCTQECVAQFMNRRV